MNAWLISGSAILLRTWEWGWKAEDGVSPTIAEFAAQCLPPDGRFNESCSVHRLQDLPSHGEPEGNVFDPVPKRLVQQNYGNKRAY